MKIYQALVFSAMLSSFSLVALASSPDKCPSASAIRAAGIQQCAITDSFYDCNKWSEFDTNILWSFDVTVTKAQAVSYYDALHKSNAALATLSNTSSPIYDQDRGWICTYSNASGYPTKAFGLGY